MSRELVERARAGDREAFSAAAGQSIGRLYAIATLILRDPDRAEDAVQDALLAAWRGIRALRDPDAWDAWLQRNVVRSCYRQTRSGRRHEVEWTRVQPASEPRTEDASISIVARDELERGFAALSLDQRAVIVLHFYAGLPLTEVAETLGISTGTAKSRLHRATQAIRARLDADERLAVREGSM